MTPSKDLSKKDEVLETKLDKIESDCTDPDEVEQISAAVFRQMKIRQGPFPDPDTLKEYKEISPEIVGRIFDFTEKIQNHQCEMEKQVLDLEKNKLKRGQNYALIVALTGIAGAVVCAFLGQVTIGTVIGGTTVITLVSTFVTGKSKKERFRDSDDIERESPNLPKKKPEKETQKK